MHEARWTVQQRMQRQRAQRGTAWQSVGRALTSSRVVLGSRPQSALLSRGGWANAACEGRPTAPHLGAPRLPPSAAAQARRAGRRAGWHTRHSQPCSLAAKAAKRGELLWRLAGAVAAHWVPPHRRHQRGLHPFQHFIAAGEARAGGAACMLVCVPRMQGGPLAGRSRRGRRVARDAQQPGHAPRTQQRSSHLAAGRAGWSPPRPCGTPRPAGREREGRGAQLGSPPGRRIDDAAAASAGRLRWRRGGRPTALQGVLHRACSQRIER